MISSIQSFADTPLTAVYDVQPMRFHRVEKPKWRQNSENFLSDSCLRVYKFYPGSVNLGGHTRLTPINYKGRRGNMQFDVRRFDVYRKVPKDLTEPTLTGAVISICSAFFIVFLLLSEFYSFISTELVSELFVDNPTENDRLDVKLNITLPRMKCEHLGLDIQDEMGRHEVGFQENTHREEINHGEGCRFSGLFNINKVPGNFHVSTHGAGQQPDNPDMAHIINSINFGTEIKEKIPGAFVALKGQNREHVNSLSSHDYVLKIVPTIYEKLDGSKTFTYQYTWAYKDYVAYGHGGRILPAIWFRYDLSPITVKYVERRKPLYHFITTVCAIVGGTFTVAGIIDSIIFTASELFKKAQLGKLS